MKKIMLSTLLMFCSSLVLAETPIIILTKGWKETPIVVNDSSNYFYAKQVCPPQMMVIPKTCGTPVLDASMQNVLLPVESDSF